MAHTKTGFSQQKQNGAKFGKDLTKHRCFLNFLFMPSQAIKIVLLFSELINLLGLRYSIDDPNTVLIHLISVWRYFIPIHSPFMPI